MDKIGSKGRQAGKKEVDDRLARFGRTRQGIDYDWRSFGCAEFGAALGVLASSGAAIMVGGAAGGRGAVISIYLDGDKHRTYINDAEQFADWCHDVLETFAEGAEDVYQAYNIKRRGE
jgi:hypothetical protein